MRRRLSSLGLVAAVVIIGVLGVVSASSAALPPLWTAAIEVPGTAALNVGGYDGAYAKSQGGYALASYLFPKAVGVGKFEILGKYAKAQFTHGTTPSYHQKTSEVNFNYVIKQFNARVMSFYKDTRFNRVKTNFWQAGVGLQFQM